MTIRMYLFFLLIFFSSLSFAGQVEGSMFNEGYSYSTSMTDRHGREYLGVAEDQGDGTVTISVEDIHGRSYSGYGRYDENGSYDVVMHDDEYAPIIARGVVADESD